MRFLTTFQLADFIDTLVSLTTAFVLGTLIGAERQYRQRTAGLRTNVLVAVGAAAFVDLAMHLTGAVGAVRVIAYVVSGIGFLGAGVIMKQGMDVRGLNTAATLWASAAVGSCAGADNGGAGGGAHRLRARRQHHAAPAGQRHQPHSARRTGLRGDLLFQARRRA
jgi:putative Mg2+ transporter-C (MgtC) family protein